MPWIGGAIAGGLSLVGGMMGSDAAGDASDAAVASADRAAAEQRRQYDLTRADNAGYMQTGNAANKRLALLMGLGETDGGKGRQAIYDRKFNELDQAHRNQYGGIGFNSSSDEDSKALRLRELNAAVDAEYAQQQGQQGQQPTDPAYGSLTRKFSMADRDADPVYQSGLQFGLDQGTGAINARAMQGGGYDSGATLKALTRYANDYGTTKAEGAYNRYNNDNTTLYNRLAGLSGTGQTATNQVSTAGQNTANNVSGLMTDAGTARAAGIVGGSNAWGGALQGVGNAVNNYNSNNWLKSMMGGTSNPATARYTTGNLGSGD